LGGKSRKFSNTEMEEEFENQEYFNIFDDESLNVTA